MSVELSKGALAGRVGLDSTGMLKQIDSTVRVALPPPATADAKRRQDDLDSVDDKLYRGMHVSTGMLAVFVAIALCRDVDLYGFDGSGVFAHSFWERPRVARVFTTSYLAERMIYEQLAVGKLPLKLKGYPIGNVTMQTLSHDFAFTAKHQAGTEGGSCKEGYTCNSP